MVEKRSKVEALEKIATKKRGNHQSKVSGKDIEQRKRPQREYQFKIAINVEQFLKVDLPRRRVMESEDEMWQY